LNNKANFDEHVSSICAKVKLKTGKIRTRRENSFQIQGPRLFNSLPTNIRNKTKCSTDEFKLELDRFLQTVPDEPNIHGTLYTPRASCQNSRKPSNKLVDQIRLLNSAGNIFGG